MAFAALPSTVSAWASPHNQSKFLSASPVGQFSASVNTGRSPADIAEALHLSVKTVHNVYYQVKSKLGVGSDFELARLAWQRGWLG